MKVERKMANSCGVCCIHKKTAAGHLVVERANSSIQKFKTIYRRDLRNESYEPIRNVSSQDFGYLARRSNIAHLNEKLGFRNRFYGSVGWEEIGAAVVVVIMAFLVPLGLYLVRRYNRTFAYGAGGCISTAFYTYDDCQILS